MRRLERWKARIENSPFFFLLAALLLQMMTVPFFGGELRPSPLLNIIYSVVLACGVWAASGSRSGLWVALTIGVPALSLRWAEQFLPVLEVPALIAALVFVSFVTWQLAKAAARQRTVTADTVCAGLCVYLLAGLAWTYGYALAQVSDPGALAPGPDALETRDLFYFSFVTLTTLGFGDFVPTSPAARMLVTMEAIFGQLFVAVFIARLVGLHSRHDP
jgi:voltage-gated potassium channel